MSDKAPEKIAFCQVDAHLDTNPKIRRAGRDGRDVFEFLLRRVAIGCTAGTVPIQYIEPWYLADVLMMTEDEARHGTSRAVTARLIEIDETAGVVRIVGWSDEWGRRPKSGAERTSKWRSGKGKSPESDERVTTSDACDETTSHVTVGDESDAGEERRREEKRDVYTRAQERHPDAGAIAHEVWQYANAKANDLRAANVNAPPWPLMASGEHTGWKRLLDRIGEALVGADVDAARKRVLNRVDVAAAKARAEGKGGYFTPSAMFSRESFDAFADLDPEQIARKPAANRRASNDEIRKVNIL